MTGGCLDFFEAAPFLLLVPDATALHTKSERVSPNNQTHPRGLATIILLAAIATSPSFAQVRVLEYAPSPPDNPLRGLVPYSGDKRDRFPHSLEFNYLPLNKLMRGMDQFNWEPLEELLDDVASRGHQAIFRVWIEYPGKNGIPQFLIDDGLKVNEWLNTNTEPFPEEKCWTPDYEDPRTRRALKNFITALGRKYDGDPRIGFITAGLLGTWGEWHTYPRTELFASKEVQAEVQDAFVAAFKTTHVLLRYPAGDNDYVHAANHNQPLGYHDDSFAWATLDTGKKSDDWFFLPALRTSGAQRKWKQQPIGGEIRPELWGQVFDRQPLPQGQDFGECVRQTHVTWLMDSGMFEREQSRDRIDRAISQVRNMGYEFHLSSVAIAEADDGKTNVAIAIRNTGIAPFYYDWKVELGQLNGSRVDKRWQTEWKVTDLLPGETRIWKTELKNTDSTGLSIRVVNPLKGGLPFWFANEGQSDSKKGWLRLD